MRSLDEIINESSDAREVKRAVCVKMALNEMPTSQICELLNVSPQYVSKWRGIYHAEGADALTLAHRGSESYLSDEARIQISAWITEHETISIEAVRDYVAEKYGVVYQSKQSYYDLLELGGMSYHKSEKRNPKRDEAKVLARRDEIKKKWSTTVKK
ncbi:MAG: helix-turn-helix domain-containing protein [Acidobacteriota bacterium]|nr:helix-turn-helix domain-containing protein [Acidobacteriota bacterium]